MILTVTPNPSLDLLFTAERLVWDDANRIDPPRRRPGGQGVNLSRAVRVLGGETLAVALLGGRTGGELEAMLREEGTPLEVVGIDADTRVFVGARERASGRSMLLNSRGAALDAGAGERLVAATRELIATREPAFVVCSGSIPPGLPGELYATIGRAAHAAGARFVVDCDGAALTAAAGAAAVLSPNAAEAERLLGLEPGAVRDERTAAAAAREIHARFGCEVAFVTLGVAGAVAADADGAWFAPAAETDPRASAVGAGDAFLAAALLELGRAAGGRGTEAGGGRTARALRAGVAAGCAVLRSSGSDLLVRGDYDDLLKTTNARRID